MIIVDRQEKENIAMFPSIVCPLTGYNIHLPVKEINL